MTQTINERMLDFQVAQQIRWIRLQNREVREALKILARVDAQIADALRAADLDSGTFSVERTRALQRQIQLLIEAIHNQLGPVLAKNLEDAAELAAEVEEGLFKRLLPAGLDIITPNLGVLQSTTLMKPFDGSPLGQWAKKLMQNDVDRTWARILDGITSGETLEDIVRGVMGTRSLRYKDGVRQVSRRGLNALVRTSINHATNTGRDMFWQANPDLIKGVRWTSTLDTRTSEICRMRDGHVGPVSPDPQWRPPNGAPRLEPPMARPPAHINCRSTTVAVTASWKDLGFDMDELDEGTRASMNGQVPASLTYFQWLDRQTPSIQKEALGQSRYDLWKQGGIAPEKFQNDEGHRFTLDQLRQRQPKAFEEAGL